MKIFNMIILSWTNPSFPTTLNKSKLNFEVDRSKATNFYKMQFFATLFNSTIAVNCTKYYNTKLSVVTDWITHARTRLFFCVYFQCISTSLYILTGWANQTSSCYASCSKRHPGHRSRKLLPKTCPLRSVTHVLGGCQKWKQTRSL